MGIADSGIRVTDKRAFRIDNVVPVVPDDGRGGKLQRVARPDLRRRARPGRAAAAVISDIAGIGRIVDGRSDDVPHEQRHDRSHADGRRKPRRRRRDNPRNFILMRGNVIVVALMKIFFHLLDLLNHLLNRLFGIYSQR